MRKYAISKSVGLDKKEKETWYDSIGSYDIKEITRCAKMIADLAKEELEKIKVGE